MSWAEILDCGDVPLTFLDNTVALKQLEKAHKVSNSAELNLQHLNERKSVVIRYTGYQLQHMLTCYVCMGKGRLRSKG